MMKLFNINHLPSEFEMNFLDKARTSYLGNAAGSEKIYVNIDKIEPGNRSCKYHSHAKQEEFFLILKGEGTLRFDGQEGKISQGDFISKPAGKGLAHQFINTGEAVLEILDIGLNVKDDITYYPDEETFYLPSQDLAFSKENVSTEWTSEPNE